MFKYNGGKIKWPFYLLFTEVAEILKSSLRCSLIEVKSTRRAPFRRKVRIEKLLRVLAQPYINFICLRIIAINLPNGKSFRHNLQDVKVCPFCLKELGQGSFAVTSRLIWPKPDFTSTWVAMLQFHLSPAACTAGATNEPKICWCLIIRLEPSVNLELTNDSWIKYTKWTNKP